MLGERGFGADQIPGGVAIKNLAGIIKRAGGGGSYLHFEALRFVWYQPRASKYVGAALSAPLSPHLGEAISLAQRLSAETKQHVYENRRNHPFGHAVRNGHDARDRLAGLGRRRGYHCGARGSV